MLDEREEEVAPRTGPSPSTTAPVEAQRRGGGRPAGQLSARHPALLGHADGRRGRAAPGGRQRPAGLHRRGGGFQPGDLVSSVDQRAVATWGNFWFALLSASLGGDDVAVEVTTADGRDAVRDLPGAERIGRLDPGRGFLAGVGLRSPVPSLPPVLAEVVPGEPAEGAGLRPGDRVLAVDGEPVDAWADLVDAVRSRPGESITLRVARDGLRRTSMSRRGRSTSRTGGARADRRRPGSARGSVRGPRGACALRAAGGTGRGPAARR
jgi:regulator of sigma E protease